MPIDSARAALMSGESDRSKIEQMSEEEVLSHTYPELACHCAQVRAEFKKQCLDVWGKMGAEPQKWDQMLATVTQFALLLPSRNRADFRWRTAPCSTRSV